MRYLITNTTNADGGPGRSVFIIEAGKLLRPGESVPVNRLESGTERLKSDKTISIKEGVFEPAPKAPLKGKASSTSSPPPVAVEASQPLPSRWDAEAMKPQPVPSRGRVEPVSADDMEKDLDRDAG